MTSFFESSLAVSVNNQFFAKVSKSLSSAFPTLFISLSHSSADFSIDSITTLSPTEYQLNISAVAPDKAYTLVVNRNTGDAVPDIEDLFGNKLDCPNSGSFAGLGIIKIISAVSVDLTHVIVEFSRDVYSNPNNPGSADCTTSLQCNIRYKIVPSLGNINNAAVLDGSVCGGAPANTKKVCVEHAALS